MVCIRIRMNKAMARRTTAIVPEMTVDRRMVPFVMESAGQSTPDLRLMCDNRDDLGSRMDLSIDARRTGRMEMLTSPLWTPPETRRRDSNLSAFSAELEERTGRTFPFYRDLHAFSVA